jgi:HAD superfamily hydrolase (TIGR01549 family)
VSYGVLFDVDGTLVDSVDAHAESWSRTLERFGHPVPIHEMRRHIGKGSDQLLPGLLPPDELERHAKEISDAKLALYMREYVPHLKAFPRVRALFEHLLAHGWRLALASSASEEELDVLKKIANIGDLIEHATTSDDADASKPRPDIFTAARDSLGLMPHQVLAVGDTPYDAEAARAGGIKTIGLLSGGFSRPSLESVGCIAVFENAADLLHHYDTSPFADPEKRDR